MRSQTRLLIWAVVQSVCLVVLLVAVGVLAYFAMQTTSRSAPPPNQALLDEHAGPVIEIFEIRIPRDVLENNLRGQRLTLASLDDLNCE